MSEPIKLLVPAHAYEMALFSQSACNLSGIAHSLADFTEAIWNEARANGRGTDYVNTHPICRLFAEQIIFLSGGVAAHNTDTWQDAHALCKYRVMVAPGGAHEGKDWTAPEVAKVLQDDYCLWQIKTLDPRPEPEEISTAV